MATDVYYRWPALRNHPFQYSRLPARILFLPEKYDILRASLCNTVYEEK